MLSKMVRIIGVTSEDDDIDGGGCCCCCDDVLEGGGKWHQIVLCHAIMLLPK